MTWKKNTSRRGRKTAVERERQQASQSLWELDNRTREDLTSLAERQLWDVQDELLALREASKEEQLSAIDRVIKLLYPYSGRPGQIEVLRRVIYGKRDLFLAAKTSWGKSMIMQAIPLLIRASVAIIVLPLNAIGEEQLLKIQAIPGSNPVFICAEVVKAHADILKHIKAGRFTHILVSPELLSSKRFHHILTLPSFRSHVSLVVIDECHLVANWGKSFRPHYAQLFKVRSLLGPTVPWFACTATLDEETYAKVMKLAGFHWSTTDLERTDIDRPDLSIIRGYIKRRDKNNYKALFFVIKEAFREEVVEEDYTSATLGKISAAPGGISAAPGGISASSSQVSATSIHQSVWQIQGPAGGAVQPKGQEVPSPELIPKTIIFLHAKNHIRGCMNTIRSWLITKGYTVEQAKIAVRSYHATLSEHDKGKEYRNFYAEDSPTRILITSDALAHGADIPDIVRSIVYGYHPDKSLNMILQRFGRAARRDGVTGYAIILIEDWYKGALADIAPPKRKSRKPTAPLSTRLGRDFIAARIAMQEDGAADFASDLASFVTVDSDVISQVSAREEEDRILNENITSLALPIEYVEKQKRAKTDAEKRAVLPDILYELANEATGCLRNILLKPYKETSPLSGGPCCCSNCDNSLQAYKEYDIVAPYTKNIAKSKYSKDLFASIKKWIEGWLDTTYQDAVWSPISSHVISDNQIRMLCIQPPLTREGLKRILPEWDHSFLGDEVDTLIHFIREEETRYSRPSVLQAASQSSRHVAVSRGSSQTPLLLVGQWGPIGTSTRSTGLYQPLQTKALQPLQLSLASSLPRDITESQISQPALTQDLQANWSQTTHATLPQSSQQSDVQYPHTPGARLPAQKSSSAYPQYPRLNLRLLNPLPQRLHCSQQPLDITPHHHHNSLPPQFASQDNLGVNLRSSLRAPQQKSDSIVGSNIGGASLQRSVRSPQRSPRAVIANQRGLVNDPAGNGLSSAAICGNLVSTATANCRIIAPSTVTQQQNTRRELAHAAGVDGYLQGRCSGSAAHLSTRARRSQRLSNSSSDRSYISAQQPHASPGGSPVRLGNSSRRADLRANVSATIELAPFQPAESTGGKSGTSRRSARVRNTTSAHIASANTTLSQSLQPILPSITALASSMTLKKTQRRPFADISGNASVNGPQPKRRISELTAQH